MIVSISNALLYPLVAFAIGYFIIQMTNKKHQVLLISPQVIRWVIFAIIVLCLVPVLSLSVYITRTFDAPFWETYSTVIRTYAVGQSWIGIAIIGTVLIVLTRFKSKAWLSFLLMTCLTFVVGFSSHAASLDQLGGTVANGLHFFSATVWIGTLFIVAWFTKSDFDFQEFIQWFSPLAVGAVFVITASGFMLMNYIVPEYVHSWVLTYGQLLLLKHLLFIPLLIFGFVHGFLLKRRMKVYSNERVKKSFKFESVVALVVFVISAFMTEQTPPHEVATTLQFEEPSALFTMILGMHPQQLLPLGLQLTLWNGIVGVVSLGLLLLFGYYLHKKTSVVISSLILCLFVLGGYATAMASIESRKDANITPYASLEEAIAGGYEESYDISILVEKPYQHDTHAVLYELDESKLVAELFKVEDDLYYRVEGTTLTVGGIPVSETDHKIRTFFIRFGDWKIDGFDYTYVSFGKINEPANVTSVDIHYEGLSRKEQVENQGFLSMTASNEEWSANHPIEFFDDEFNIIGGYMRGFMEEGVYCH
ncbi:copper resistance D family protein [Alkalihalobacterium bogoriense]|uniref:copper resistance D family protein n=1 Tax=Alkalihalobacterium bogoriense TaxID=246272 RepID=UPI0004796C64|nr:copper resistance D family protein [Alkalihalobacterium bogoriense]